MIFEYLPGEALKSRPLPRDRSSRPLFAALGVDGKSNKKGEKEGKKGGEGRRRFLGRAPTSYFHLPYSFLCFPLGIIVIAARREEENEK